MPSWVCPSCMTGILKADNKHINIYESAVSKSCHSHPAWEPEWINGGFVGILECSNTNCSDKISVIGKMTSVEKHEFDEESGSWEFVIRKELTPTQFYPTIKIFPINKDVPENISEIIMSAFSLYWTDLSSCANKIRTVAEYIMDNKKIPKTYTYRSKRKKYTLHRRIEIFKVTNNEEADLLMAIKWIGNSGSHQFDNLTQDDILDSFEILELVTTKLYETDSIRIKKLSKDINKRKKAIGNKKKSSR